MTLSLQDIKPEEIDALKKQSQAEFDAEIQRRDAVVSAKPALQEVLHQKVHPQTLCGCGCRQNICGFFNLEGCGCGCSPHTETVQISSSLANIGPNAPQNGTPVRFIGQATGTGTNLDINDVYLQGIVPDAENLIGIQLSLQLSINQGELSLAVLEGNRLLAVLVHPANSEGNIDGQFYGSGIGMFQRA